MLSLVNSAPLWNRHIIFTDINSKGNSTVVRGDKSRNSQKSVLLACFNLMAFKAENAAPGSNTNSIASNPQNTSYSKQENLKGRNEYIRPRIQKSGSRDSTGTI